MALVGVTPSQAIQALNLDAQVILHEIDATRLGGTVLYFHNGTNELRQPVVWQGRTYPFLPIQTSGFEWTGKGPLPQPKLLVANIDGFFTILTLTLQDLIGAKVTRRRTLVRFLDSVNFASGKNELATTVFGDNIYNSGRNLGTGNKISSTYGDNNVEFDPPLVTLQDAIVQIKDAWEASPISEYQGHGRNFRLSPDYGSGNFVLCDNDTPTPTVAGYWTWDGVDRNTGGGVAVPFGMGYEFAKDVYFIERKASDAGNVIQFDLKSSFDMAGVKIPLRLILADVCSWEYQGPDCGYIPGPMYDIQDKQVAVPELDVCGHRYRSCTKRFGSGKDVVLPFGGFPAAGLIPDG